jgi:hypothetical protein
MGEPARAGKIGLVGAVPLEDKDTNILPQNPPSSEDMAAEGTQPEEKTNDVGSDDEHDEVSLTSYIKFSILTVLQWCSGCSNGGILINCSFCRYRAACDVCIQFPPPATLQSSIFMCPVCHLSLREKDPYYVSSLISFDPL